MNSDPLKIVYGVCGIGRGHVHRQLPVIEYLIDRGSEIVFFAYGTSLAFLQQRYADHSRIQIEEVAVPFYVGDRTGLDFEATIRHPKNQNISFLDQNCKAMDRTFQRIGRPDLVITDYEPISAQYAYAHGSPLITIDQQSKYLCRSDWPEIGEQSCIDEVARLRMFFPEAHARIACSFFKVPASSACPVELHGPVIQPRVLEMKSSPIDVGRDILLYLSSQRPFEQSFEEILDILASEPSWRFSVFAPSVSEVSSTRVPSNVTLFPHGDPHFFPALERSAAVISTAGHTLLSESMYLDKPVFALPLPVYEQQMNANVISENGFGIARTQLSATDLHLFLENLDLYAEAIKSDKEILLREPGQNTIIRALQAWCLRPGQVVASGLLQSNDPAVGIQPTSGLTC